MKIGLIGDYNESVTAHAAIPLAIAAAAKELGVAAEYHWIHSDDIDVGKLSNYSALWCVPASPYQNTEKVLRAIEYALTENVPFLGTCGGYQHAALEYAVNALGVADAENAEINPSTTMPLIAELSCKLYDTASRVFLEIDTSISEIYDSQEISEEYYCGYGVNRQYLELYIGSDMLFSGFDEDGDPRTLELINHKFFIGTAFQPERSAMKGVSHPLIRRYLAVAGNT